MPTTHEVTTYKYEELDEKAKAKARDWYREACAGDEGYAEFVLEDAKHIAPMLGVDLATREIKLRNGETRRGAKIYYSGFWSQGDGASFYGAFYAENIDTQALANHAPNNAESNEALWKVAARFAEIKSKYGKRGLSAKIDAHPGNYSHSNMMRFEWDTDEYEGEEDEQVKVDYNLTRDEEKECEAALRSFADWIYRQLEEAYNYANSDESVAESIEANEYDFTADGRRYKYG